VAAITRQPSLRGVAFERRRRHIHTLTEANTMASEKTRGAPKKQTKKPKAPSTAKAARREAAKKAHQSPQSSSI
jgi:hypothetical protein